MHSQQFNQQIQSHNIHSSQKNQICMTTHSPDTNITMPFSMNNDSTHQRYNDFQSSKFLPPLPPPATKPKLPTSPEYQIPYISAPPKISTWLPGHSPLSQTKQH